MKLQAPLLGLHIKEAFPSQISFVMRKLLGSFRLPADRSTLLCNRSCDMERSRRYTETQGINMLPTRENDDFGAAGSFSVPSRTLSDSGNVTETESQRPPPFHSHTDNCDWDTPRTNCRPFSATYEQSQPVDELNGSMYYINRWPESSPYWSF